MSDHDDLVGLELAEAVADREDGITVADLADGFDPHALEFGEDRFKTLVGGLDRLVERGQLMFETRGGQSRRDHEDLDFGRSALDVASEFVHELGAPEFLVGHEQDLERIKGVGGAFGS